jgi:hypothetical protein
MAIGINQTKMIENFTKKAIPLAEIVHRRFFGHEMSEVFGYVE